MGLAQREEIVPAVLRVYDAVAVRSKKARLEVKGAKKMTGRVREWKRGGPSDELGRVRGGSGGEELEVIKVHDALKGACRKPIPLWPPTATRMAHGLIRGMLQHELDAADVGGSRVDAVRVGSCERRIHANKMPTRASSAGRKVQDEEELIRAGSKGRSKRDGRRSRDWGERCVSSKHWKGFHRGETWKGARSGKSMRASG